MAKQVAQYPNALRACIKQAGYSFREVSQETDIPERTLYDWATGNRPIPKRERQVIADLLGYPVEVLAPQRPAHRMIQLLQDQAALPASSYVPTAASGVLVPSSVVQVEAVVGVGLFDWPTWFGQQLTDLTSLIESWQAQRVPYQQLQALVHTELERWNTMAHQSDGNSSEVLVPRRTALAALAMLSTTLVAKVQTGPLTAVLMEDFLTQCTASITSCWHLLNGDGLATVEYALAKYLPLLVALTRQSSPYQKTAAHLAAQGSLLMSLVSYHRLRFRDEQAYADQAVTLAKVSEDRNLHVYALTFLGCACEFNGQLKAMLQKYQEAARYLDEVVPPLRSNVLADLAYAYACNGQVQEALGSIGEARNLFSSEFAEVPCFLSPDHGLFQLILLEGQVHLSLGQSDAEHVQQHSQQAMSALAQFGQLPSTIMVPERYRIQIINEQAKAAIGVRNMEEFEHYLLAGVEGAKALRSEKRRQEAIANWKAARKAWPREEKILKLAALLMEQ